MPNYEGLLEIWKNIDLSLLEQVIEHHFAVYLQSDLVNARSSYRVENGNVLDTDRARALSSVWNLSNMSRAICSSAVHNPASAFVNDLFLQMIRQDDGNIVIFTAGGGGSGKSAAMRQFAPRMADQALLIYDTTLSNQSAAVEKVETVLHHGKTVVILYVYRPFAAAVSGVIQRAILSGRTVPLNVLAQDHIRAPQTVLHIARTYSTNDNVQIVVLDNSGEDVSEVSILIDRQQMLNFLQNIAYNRDTESFLRLAKGVLEDEASKGYIPEYILTVFGRDYQRREST